MGRYFHIEFINSRLLTLAFGLFLGATLSSLSAHAKDINTIGFRTATATSRLNILTTTLPADFGEKCRKAGLSIIEIERLDRLHNNIISFTLDKNKAPKDLLQSLNTIFPQSKFEILDTTQSAFEFVDF